MQTSEQPFNGTAPPAPVIAGSPLSCWVATVEYAGMESQGIGLAEALGLAWTRKRVRPRAPWKYLPSRWWWRPLSMVATEDGCQPPWPDVLISCGWRSVALALAVRQASGGRTFTIHVQHPQISPHYFDRVVAPEHDGLRGDNVIVTQGALHRVTPARLGDAAKQFAPRLAHLPHPRVAVLVGGSNRRQQVAAAVINDLADQLLSLARNEGAGLIVTPSRRTGAANEQLLRERLREVQAQIWDGQGENPYFGYLALADALVVTGDSVSMVSEACATGKPVYVYELEGAGRRLRRFHQGLRAAGITRPFTGILEPWSYPPPDDTARAAAIIRPALAKRFGFAVTDP